MRDGAAISAIHPAMQLPIVIYLAPTALHDSSRVLSPPQTIAPPPRHNPPPYIPYITINATVPNWDQKPRLYFHPLSSYHPNASSPVLQTSGLDKTPVKWPQERDVDPEEECGPQSPLSTAGLTVG